jgi:hypothetical protein
MSLAEKIPTSATLGHSRYSWAMFVAYRPSMIDEPWDDWQDAHLLEDFGWGCTAFTMAMRSRRTEAEVLARLAALGMSIQDQPRGRRIRNTTWTRRSA